MDALTARAATSLSSHQVRFHQRWPELRDPHVRALAWLLYAPDLLAQDAPCWEGRIATLGPVAPEVAGWLHDLEHDLGLNAALHAHLARQPTARLGRYAEQLLTFYLQQQDWLVAANLQVRQQGPTHETLGEFDFLVRPPGDDEFGLIHWEFATKFYLLAPQSVADAGTDAGAFVGPNLADTLGKKMRKIMRQQLMLSAHPAAASVLPAPVTAARALVKGWLFYRHGEAVDLPASLGVAADHCRGFWCELPRLAAQHLPDDLYLILPRLAWLAPARAPMAQGLSLPALQAALETAFLADQSPVMVAQCRIAKGAEPELLELARGFIVPPGWELRAADTARHALVRI
ncbi:DUF1853 family protein [Herbaspirillum seropedicae]|uniref:DUF1853 family protein n=1 Tax=Herbaspirillum seropedicae TaxID=964 RepID=UPI003D9719AE